MTGTPGISQAGEVPDAWSLTAGLNALSDIASNEERILDAMHLIVAYHPSEAEDEVISAIRHQMLNGKTSEIRSQAVTSLGLMSPPETMAVVEEALPDLDEKTRDEAEWMLQSRLLKKARRAGSAKDPEGEELSIWLDARIEKVSNSAAKRAEKLRRKLLRYELEMDTLLSEPVVTADISVGGIGYRLDIVPKREEAANVTIWVGFNGIRCSVGPRKASLTRYYALPMKGWFWAFSVCADIDKVLQGKLKEFVSPNGVDSLVLIELIGKTSEPYKSGSTVPDEGQLPDDWQPRRYEPYGA